MTSKQMILMLDDEEGEIVERFAQEIKVSKMNAIKLIIRQFGKTNYMKGGRK